jgi:hypothetical protein
MKKRKVLTFITAITFGLTSMFYTSSYVVADDGTAAVTASEESEGIYFLDKGVMVETGKKCGITLFGYNDDKIYDYEESPIKFTIDDESIAKIIKVHGDIVQVNGINVGTTELRAETPDGQKASVKIAVVEVPPTTTTTAVWSQPTKTTMTTTQPITSTVIYDYAPTIEFDKSPMSVGETREGRFYNPETKKTENGSVYSTSDAISIDYTKGSDTFKITALKAGEASISFNAKGCAFSGYVSLKVIDDKIKGDANGDGTVDMSDVVLIMQALANPNKYGENGTAEVHLTAQGKANADMDGDGLTVGDAQAIQKMLLELE